MYKRESLEITPDRHKQTVNLDPLWLPFTPNRQFKSTPRLIAGAKDMHYFTDNGQSILDGISGLWCVNAGHCRDRIVEAIQSQAKKLDYSTAFNVSHEGAFKAAETIANIAPDGLDHVFFTNSGSEGVDSALKIAIGYHRIKGSGHRHRLIGREKSYHGVGFGGMSVGGIVPNRKMFSMSLLPGVDHLSHTLDIEKNAFTHGQPQNGLELANELEEIVRLHDATNIAAVIVEPIAGSAGVLVPPVGYLKRLREICDKHGILLIFDEVITGFGRTGNAFASQTFDVTPDMIVFAKGVTNGTVPMGGVIVKSEIYDAFMTGPEWAIEFYHGYTYSGHPLASAAANATLQTYELEGLFERSKVLSPYFEEAVHSLKGLPNVIDIRNYGLMCGIQLLPVENKPLQRTHDIFEKCFEKNVLVRAAGENIALTPPLIATEEDIDLIVDTLRNAINRA